ELFLKYFVNHNDQALWIQEFRQEWAFGLGANGFLDWGAVLAIIRETYHSGAWRKVRRGLYRANPLPEEIAAEFLANPQDYPIALWESAINAAEMKTRKAVRPVGKVAKTERWFAEVARSRVRGDRLRRKV